MTCEECEQAQDGRIGGVSFIRVDASNVMIVGCRKHLRRLIDIYRHGLEVEEV